jgi:hypothetical protein
VATLTGLLARVSRTPQRPRTHDPL